MLSIDGDIQDRTEEFLFLTVGGCCGTQCFSGSSLLCVGNGKVELSGDEVNDSDEVSD